MAENGGGKPSLYERYLTGYRKFAEKATVLGDKIIYHFGVTEIERAPEVPPVSTTVDKWGRPAGEFVKAPSAKGPVSDIGLIPDGAPDEGEAAQDRHPATENKPKVYDRQADETLPEGVTRLIPKDQR